MRAPREWTLLVSHQASRVLASLKHTCVLSPIQDYAGPGLQPGVRLLSYRGWRGSQQSANGDHCRGAEPHCCAAGHARGPRDVN